MEGIIKNGLIDLFMRIKFSCINKLFWLMLCLMVMPDNLFSQKLKINQLDYFEGEGLNVLVFSNEYNGLFFDEKTAGIELIHHGVRTSTGGAVRLQHTPEQWDLIPRMLERKVDKITNSIEVVLRYDDFDFDSKIRVTPQGKGFIIQVSLDKPIPEALVGRAGFNLEFLPTAYFERSYLADGQPGIFPKYPAGKTHIQPISNKIKQFGVHTTFDDRGKGEFIEPFALAIGKTIVMAPEDPAHGIKIQSESEIMLFDARNLAQNGWFVVRSLLPANQTGNVLTWFVEPYTISNWRREPVIGFSQAGYIPDQEKVAVIELDKNDLVLDSASLYQVTVEGKLVEKLKGQVKLWGQYYRYNYAKFDFSSIKEAGIYFIKYGEKKTNTFPIAANVYDEVWHPTLDVWFPNQMDHMQVNEAYRVWHGAPFLDDCLQAPLNHEHFDGYNQGSTTDTRYKPLERIPGMAVGGWFDAGDFDIQTGSHNSVISSFVELWETFGVDRDQTYIDQQTRYVDMHRPDGKPDLLQQIEHGVLNLVAQIENIGHPVRGIVVPHLHQYHHLGDAATSTDNLRYNAKLKPYETEGLTSGTLDDRWAFTNRMSFLDYQTAASLSAAHRALKGYNNDLSAKCLSLAERLMQEADEASKKELNNANNPMNRWMRGSDMNAALQLFISTGEKSYADRFLSKLWPLLDSAEWRHLNTALLALPHMDAAYSERLKNYVTRYKQSNDGINMENPYGVPIVARGWGGSSQVINWAIINYYAHKAYPGIISSNDVFRGLNYVFGCHPYSNLSFVNGVGTRSKHVAYGNNRADFTTIAGGVVPGLIFLKPDYLENKDDWPFLWGENECIIDGGAWYIFLSNAAADLAENLK